VIKEFRLSDATPNTDIYKELEFAKIRVGAGTDTNLESAIRKELGLGAYTATGYLLPSRFGQGNEYPVAVLPPRSENPRV
jgi:hypothetical protein